MGIKSAISWTEGATEVHARVRTCAGTGFPNFSAVRTASWLRLEVQIFVCWQIHGSKLAACSFGWWLMTCADLLWEKSIVDWLLVAGLFWEKSTADLWLISQTNRALVGGLWSMIYLYYMLCFISRWMTSHPDMCRSSYGCVVDRDHI
jgi:hypothetical protein